MTFFDYDTEAGPLLGNILCWKSLSRQQKIQRAIMVYKALHGLAPDYLKTKFQERQATYTLRDSENKLKVPFPRTNYYKNSFSYSGATLWNSLPLQARKAESLGVFKRLLDGFI